MRRPVPRVLRILAYLAAIPVAGGVALGAGYLWFGLHPVKAIRGPAPEGFPVVVFWESQADRAFHARVLPLEEVPAHRADHPGATFLMPPGRLEDLHRELASQTRGEGLDLVRPHFRREWTAWAWLREDREGRQVWVASLHPGREYVNRGTYVATAAGVTPTHLERFFGPGRAMLACLIALAAWPILALALILFLAWRFRRACPATETSR